MNLINWHWLEELLLRGCEMETRAFAPHHLDERFHAFCLEFDADAGTLACSYGDRASVEQAAEAARAAEVSDLQYRRYELYPQHWQYRRVPLVDPDGAWETAEVILKKYRENLQTANNGEVHGDATPVENIEFYHLRFEYLADTVVRGLVERDVFRSLRQDDEFLAFASGPSETLEELEDRIVKAYPNYHRATREWVRYPRLDEFRRRICSGPGCGKQGRGVGLLRCTACGSWFCASCREEHLHPELAEPQPFFDPLAEWPMGGDETGENS